MDYKSKRAPGDPGASHGAFVGTKLSQLDDSERKKGVQLLTGLYCGAGVVVLDFFIVLVCLRSIQQDLGASPGQLQLVMAAYAIANGSFLVLGGRLGDVFGRRRMYVAGVALFAVATGACAMASTAWVLIGFRVLQGLGGALLQPQVLGLLTINSAPEDRQRIFGIYAAVLGGAGIAAQLVGGLLVELLPLAVGWRMCFLVGLPVCAVSLWLSREAQEGARRPGGVDILGASLLVISLGAFSTFMTFGRDEGWPTWAWITLATALVFGIGLVAWVRSGRGTARERLVPADLLDRADVWGALFVVFLFFCGVASFYFVLALELRDTAGLGPLQSGLMFGWLGLCFVVAASSSRLKRWVRSDRRVVGSLLLIAGHVLLANVLTWLQASEALLVGISAACLLDGIGLGLLMGGVVATAVSKFRQDEASLGGGLVATTQQIGNSLGLVAIGFAYFGLEDSGRASVVKAAALLVALLLCLMSIFIASTRAAKPTTARPA